MKCGIYHLLGPTPIGDKDFHISFVVLIFFIILTGFRLEEVGFMK